jgi:tetratricopeptide (TPR) repeat protein
MGVFSRLLELQGNRHCERGDLEKAIRWYARAKNFQRVAELYEEQGQFAQAIEAWVRSGNRRKAATRCIRKSEFLRAAELLREEQLPLQAARCYFLGGDAQRAVTLYLELGDRRRAAQIYEQSGKFERAAQYYALGGHLEEAIRLYKRLGQRDIVLQMYDKKGRCAEDAQACEANGEYAYAAALWERAGQLDRAAALYVLTGDTEKAVGLFVKNQNFEKAGEIYEQHNQLQRAAEYYERDAATARRAAALYEILLVCEQVQQVVERGEVICAAHASKSGHLIVGLDTREVVLLDERLERMWQFKMPGGASPISLGTDEKASHIVVGSDDGQLNCLDDKHKVVWQKEYPETVRGISVSREGDSAVITTGDTVQCLDAMGNVTWELETSFKAWSVCHASDQETVYAGTLAGDLYSLDPGGVVRKRRSLGSRVYRLRCGSQSDHVVAGIGENQIGVYTSALEEVWRYTHGSGIEDFLLLSNEPLVVVADAHNVMVFDLQGRCHGQWQYEEKVRVLSADSRPGHYTLALDKHVVQSLRLLDCKRRAAACYDAGNDLRKAAEIYESITDYKEAFRLYKEVGEFEKAAQSIHLIGDVMTAASHFEKAGNFEKAAGLYEEIQEFAKAAYCYGKAGNFEKAAELYEGLSDKLLSASFYERAGLYSKAAKLYRDANQNQQAILNYQKHLDEYGEDSQIAYALGVLYLREERTEEAIKIFQKLVPVEEYRRDALVNLAECFVQEQLYDIAIDRYTECLGGETKVTFENRPVFYGLGLAYELAGRLPNAKEIYEKILAVDFYYRDVRDRLKRVEELSAVFSEATGSPAASHSSMTRMVHNLSDDMRRRYQILSRLGEGGMGVVYLALDRKLNRQVAWKVLPTHLSNNEVLRQRLVREARATARLNHPHIVAIYDVGAEKNECFISMEYIKGINLRKILQEHERLPVLQTLRYSLQIADALSQAHKENIIHRDIKPENIMITTDGDNVKVMDFGLARLADEVSLTREGSLMGSLPYMAPEQVKGKDVDTRTDIYAMGIMMYELLAGRTPFVGGNLLAQHLHSEPPPLEKFCPDVPETFRGAIFRCLEKDREQRPKDGSELFELLRSVSPETIH